MFRSLISSLFTTRPQAKVRRQVLHFRPQLETLEGRLAPSSFHHSDVDVTQIQYRVGFHNTQVAVAPSHGDVDILQVQAHVGSGNTQVAIVGGHEHH
ncbi:MAG TPA: hypothetical protein VH643_23050 [Gemmataceae bacterium]|jgi:hypothetical protein